jgi:hypothetical protein
VSVPKPWTIPPGGRKLESGQAWVYEVVGPSGTKRFALKRLKNPKRADRFKREIEAMSALRSRGVSVVPPVIEESVDPQGRPYYVMPWYADGSLEEAITTGRFAGSPVDGLELLVRIAQALRVLHESGWTHRDLKPANVLLDGSSPVLADLGLALEIAADPEDRLTATGEAIGSRFFIAPENESGIFEDVDQRPADFYAFGKLLWVVLSGQTALAREIQLERSHRLESILDDQRMRAVDDLSEQLLRTDPRTRLTDWDPVESELAALASTLSSATAPLAALPGLDEALEAARRYRQSDAARAAQQTETRRAAVVAELARLKEAAEPEVTAYSLLCNQLTEASGGNFQVIAGGIVLPLETVAPPVRVHGSLELPDTSTLDAASLSSPWLAALQMDVLRSTQPLPSLSLLGYALIRDNEVWMLRAPLLRGHLGNSFPPTLLHRYGALYGPFAFGLSQARDAAVRLAHDVGDVGVSMVTEYLRHIERGKDPFDPSTWAPADD